MEAPRICVAGVDLESKKHVRPVVGRGAQLDRRLLVDADGPLELGAVIELRTAKARPDRPEVEDVQVDPSDLVKRERLDGEEYMSLIDQVSETDLESAFGPDLLRREWKYAVDVGEGMCSLGCVRAQRRPALEISDKYERRLQLRFNDAARPAYVPVNDLRFYEADHRTLKRAPIEDAQARLRRGVGVWIMFGLARPFRARGDDEERHWLQVNGLCLEDSPLGSLP